MNRPVLPSPPDDWFVEAFGEFYPQIYAHRSDEAAVKEVTFAVEVAHPDPAYPLLDCGCGAGRHLRWLIKRFPLALGMDYSMPLLHAARQRLGPGAQLIRADMRRLPFPDGALGSLFSFFTSFGYFSDADNGRVVAEWARALRKGGTLFLDFLNAERVRLDLVPESTRNAGPWRVREWRWIDAALSRVNKRILLDHPEMGCCREFHESVRLYSRQELEQLLASQGFHVTHAFGDYGGEPWRPDSKRLILVAKTTGCD